MQRIETRTQLIEFISTSGLSHALSRACHRGAVKVLGGFSQILPSADSPPGWIVEVTSEFDHTWYVAVYPDESRRIFRVRFVNEVPWEFYVATGYSFAYSLYFGDHPDESMRRRYLRKREKAHEQG